MHICNSIAIGYTLSYKKIGLLLKLEVAGLISTYRAYFCNLHQKNLQREKTKYCWLIWFICQFYRHLFFFLALCIVNTECFTHVAFGVKSKCRTLSAYIARCSERKSMKEIRGKQYAQTVIKKTGVAWALMPDSWCLQAYPSSHRPHLQNVTLDKKLWKCRT